MSIQQLHTYCPMCVSRCGVVATVEDGILQKVNADPLHPNGCICVKGSAASEIVYSPDRLQYPMRRTRPKGEQDPGWVRISWEEAMTLAASRLLDIKAQYGAEAVVFGIETPAGSATSDYWDWLLRLANAFGSPNFTDPIYICAWNWLFGSQYTYGVMRPPPDYDHARCILLWGHNPEASWPAAAMRISQARSKGAKLIVIDPRQHSLAQKADAEHGKRRPAASHYIAPLWIPAILSRSDRLAQSESEVPWLSRDLLEPVRGGGNEMVLGSTESLDEFLSNNEVPETGEGWTAYWAYANAMLSHVARDAGWSYADVSVDDAAKNETVGRGFDLVAAGLDPHRLYQTDRGSFVLADTRIQGASTHILKLYDHLRTRKIVPPLLDRYSHIDRCSRRPTLSSAEQQAKAARHLGQMSDEFELAPSQRQALHHCLAIGPGEILAVNGPPGTGKTTLLQSIVATLFVERALDGKEPPIVVVASTNNQAVTNVIDSFGRVGMVNHRRDPSVERLVGRWLPDDALTSYALYCPSKERMKEGHARGFLMTDPKGEGFPKRIRDRAYVTKAHAFFLDRTTEALGREVRTVDQAVELLHRRLQEQYEILRAGPEKRSTLERQRLGHVQAEEALHAADCALRDAEQKRDHVGTVARDAEIHVEAMGAEILAIRQVRASWVKQTERRPWWVALCASWFRCARRRIRLGNEVFFGEAPVKPAGINLADDEAIAEWFRDQLKRLEDTRTGLQRQAVERGVAVTCYIDARLNCDSHGVERSAAKLGKELLHAAGATVGIARNIHNKTLCVDDWLIRGVVQLAVRATTRSWAVSAL